VILGEGFVGYVWLQFRLLLLVEAALMYFRHPGPGMMQTSVAWPSASPYTRQICAPFQEVVRTSNNRCLWFGPSKGTNNMPGASLTRPGKSGT
jgi:hypothetical protein